MVNFGEELSNAVSDGDVTSCDEQNAVENAKIVGELLAMVQEYCDQVHEHADFIQEYIGFNISKTELEVLNQRLQSNARLVIHCCAAIHSRTADFKVSKPYQEVHNAMHPLVSSMAPLGDQLNTLIEAMVQNAKPSEKETNEVLKTLQGFLAEIDKIKAEAGNQQGSMSGITSFGSCCT